MTRTRALTLAIVADLDRAKSRVAGLESGAHGQNADAGEARGHMRGPALEAQLRAQRAHVSRLEREYVLALLDAPGGWSSAAVIEAMGGAR